MQSNDKDTEDGWLASIEDEYLASMAAEPDYETQYITERESSMSGMWSSFQESATSIAQLYRGKHHTQVVGRLCLVAYTLQMYQTNHSLNSQIDYTPTRLVHCGCLSKLPPEQSQPYTKVNGAANTAYTFYLRKPF